MKNIKEHNSESQASFAHQSDIPRPLTSLSDMFAWYSGQVVPQTRSVDFEQKIISAKISFARNEEHQRTQQWVTNFTPTSFAHQSDIPRPLTWLPDMFAQWVSIIWASRAPNMVRQFRAKDNFCQNKFCAKWRTSKKMTVSHKHHTNIIRTLIWEHVHCLLPSLLFIYFILIIMLLKFCDRFVSFVMISDLWDFFWHICLVNFWKRFSQILLPHAECQKRISNLPLIESYKTHLLKIKSRKRYFKSFKTQ